LTCCMGEKYSWCQSQYEGVVYTDGEGKEYCLFHAPQGKKGMTLPQFNGKILEEIGDAMYDKRRCDLSGTIFEGDIDFTSSHSFPDISFNDGVFNGEAKLNNIVFAGSASFSNTKFVGDASFVGSTFKEYTNFFLRNL